MTDNEIIIEIAKLDGRDIRPDNFVWDAPNLGIPVESVTFKPYLTSRNAIVPVIDKVLVTPEQRADFIDFLANTIGVEQQLIRPQTFACVLSPAKHLSIALLKATGKWKE